MERWDDGDLVTGVWGRPAQLDILGRPKPDLLSVETYFFDAAFADSTYKRETGSSRDARRKSPPLTGRIIW